MNFNDSANDVAQENPPSVSRPLFHGINRGILVAVVYAAVLWQLYSLVLWPRIMDASMNSYLPDFVRRYLPALLHVVVFAAGTIAAFSNTAGNESAKRDLVRNLLDGFMVAVWLGVVNFGMSLLCINFEQLHKFPGTQWWQVWLLHFGISSGFCILGALIGEPIFSLIGKISIKGHHPFLFINEVTSGIANKDLQFVVRVLLQTIVFAVLITAAVIGILVFIAIIVVSLIIYIILRSLSDEPPADKPPVKRKIRAGGYLNRNTWERIDQDGYIVRDGIVGSTQTGMRVADDGQILRAGLLSDEPTGLRLAPASGGLRQIVREEVIGTSPTGFFIDEHGNALEEDRLLGIGRHQVNISIRRDGTVAKDS